MRAREFTESKPELNQAVVNQMTPRIPQLQQRCNTMLARLIKASQVARELAGVRVYVSISDGFAQSSPKTREINLDVTAFWNAPDDVLAFVIGHELGHIALHHPDELHQEPALNQQEELDADAYGIRLAIKLGYSKTKALSFCDVPKSSPTDSFSHPSYDRRIQSSQQQFPQFELSKAGQDQLSDLKAALAQA